jgi:hypothetical protein
MFKLFEKESIIAYLILALVVILIGVKVFVTGSYLADNNSSLAFHYLLKTQTWNIVLVKTIILICILLSLLFFSLIFKDFSYQSKSGLIAVFVVCVNTLLSLIFPFNLEGVFSVLLFLILSYTTARLEKKKDTTSSIFNIGFLFALSIAVTYYMSFFIVPLIFALFIFGRNGIRDLLALMIGILVPIVIFLSIILLTNNIDLLGLIILPIKILENSILANWEWLVFGYSILSFLLVIPLIAGFTIATRKFYTFLFFCILTLLPVFIFIGFSGSKPFYLILFVSSFYTLPFLLKAAGNRLKNVMLILGLFGAIFVTFVQFK